MLHITLCITAKKKARPTNTKPRSAYRIHFCNGESIVKHYYSFKQAHGHAMILAISKGTDANKVIIEVL